MADSNLTKRALAGALKELMGERSFSGVSVTDICDKCNMNRKSFYYHFRDKWGLLNWIFDTEFVQVGRERESEGMWDILEALCGYFYENRDFYRKAFRIEGQNSFSEHFRELLCVYMRQHLQELYGIENAGDFQVNFFSDAIAMAFRRWLTDKCPMEPDEFLAQLRMCVTCITPQIERGYESLQGS